MNAQCGLFLLVFILCNSPNDVIASNAQDDVTTATNLWNSTEKLYSFYSDENGGKIYVGGENWIYQIDANNISKVLRQIEWKPDAHVLQACRTFKGPNGTCGNSIRILHAINSTHLYACGTMAFNPSCCYILKEILVILPWTITSADMKSPHDPFTSSVSIVANRTLFTATRGSLMGDDGIIAKALNGTNLRTPGGDKFWLHDPEFVNMHHARDEDPNHDKLMIFFRELAEEFKPFNFGLSRKPNERMSVSRVATVCLNDHGGITWVLNRKFTTFTKMSITCSSSNGDPSMADFRYDNIVSTFSLHNPIDPFNPKIYALFSSPRGATEGTALCTYNSKKILEAMKSDVYWSNPTNGGNSNKIRYNRINGPEPGKCVTETKGLKPARLMFGQRHPLKFGSIYPSTSKPLYQEAGATYNHILVRAMPAHVTGLPYDVTVLFLANDNGKLKRVVVNEASQESWGLPGLMLIKESPDMGSIKCLKMILQEEYLLVMTNKSLEQIPLSMCGSYKTCAECLNARDPFCTWSSQAGKCTSVFKIRQSEKNANQLRPSNQTCPNEPDKPDLVTELRENVTRLLTRDTQWQEKVEVLEEKSKECRMMREKFDIAVGNLTVRLMARNREVKTGNWKLESINQQLALCHQEVKLATAKANRNYKTAQKLDENELMRKLKKLERSRQDQQMELLRCTASLGGCKEDVTSLNDSLRVTSYRLEDARMRCLLVKDEETTSLRTQVRVLRNVSEGMRHDLAVTKNMKCNESKTVRSCHDKVRYVIKDVRRLKALNRNMSSDVAMLRLRHERNVQLIRQLTWLHRKNGERGQQRCEYEGWFLSNLTGSLFKFGDTRMKFLEAKAYCMQHESRLAVFKDPLELRYVNNVIRAFSRKQPFWIGLVKHKNGTLRWQDSTIMQPSELERFPKSQDRRLNRKNRAYCVEISQTLRWSLIPCKRTRRPICQRVMPVLSTSDDEQLFQVMVKSRR